MRQSALLKLQLLVFRTLSFGCVCLGSVGALAFAVSAFFPGQSVAIDLFAAAMGALIAVVGIKGLAIRSRDDVDRDISTLSERRDKFERWINRDAGSGR
jgi:hypothetical protein